MYWCGVCAGSAQVSVWWSALFERTTGVGKLPTVNTVIILTIQLSDHNFLKTILQKNMGDVTGFVHLLYAVYEISLNALRPILK